MSTSTHKKVSSKFLRILSGGSSPSWDWSGFKSFLPRCKGGRTADSAPGRTVGAVWRTSVVVSTTSRILNISMFDEMRDWSRENCKSWLRRLAEDSPAPRFCCKVRSPGRKVRNKKDIKNKILTLVNRQQRNCGIHGTCNAHGCIHSRFNSRFKKLNFNLPAKTYQK